MAPSSNLDHAVDALILVREAQHAIDAALRLPTADRVALAEQIGEVRHGVGAVGSSLVARIPDAELAARPELRALGGMVSFFAGRGSQALGAVAGAAASVGDERDPSLVLSERIAERLDEVGVATRRDLARELEVDPRSSELRDALERVLGTGRAEWYGSGTYGLPRAQLERMLARARDEPEETAGEMPVDADRGGGAAIAELRATVDGLRTAIARRTGTETTRA